MGLKPGESAQDRIAFLNAKLKILLQFRDELQASTVKTEQLKTLKEIGEVSSDIIQLTENLLTEEEANGIQIPSNLFEGILLDLNSIAPKAALEHEPFSFRKSATDVISHVISNLFQDRSST
jgi:hypothetical protein